MRPCLFEPLRLRNIEIPNRVVISPMCQYSAENGVAGDWHLMHLGQYSVSGAGLVFAEATGVEAEGRISPGCPGLYNDEQEAAFKRVVDFFELYGTAVPAIQLAHAGRKGSTATPWNGGKPLSDVDGAWETFAPSAVPFDNGWHVPTEMSRTHMDRIREAFVSSAQRAQRAGFKVLELHGAHGYLLSEFLSPIANKREDEYGGSLENRMRYVLEIFDAVRAIWPKELPLGMRLSATDWEDPGITIEETVAVTQVLKDHYCDFVDISAGGNLASRPPVGTSGPAYQVPFAEQVKRETGMTTIAVGMIRDPLLAEEVLSEGKADFIALARGALYDPRWAWHAAASLGAEAPYPQQYIRSRPDAWPKAFPELMD